MERTSLLCPAPSTSDLAETTYTSFTPVTKGTGSDGKAELRPPRRSRPPAADSGKSEQGQEGAAKPVLTPKEPGKPVAGDTSGGRRARARRHRRGQVRARLDRPGDHRGRRGHRRAACSGVNCTAPDTEFWFPGASTAADRTDYVHLTNPDDSAAVVDIELYGKDGAAQVHGGRGHHGPGRTSSEPILLSTLTAEKQADLTVHVNVRSGRVGAAVQAAGRQARRRLAGRVRRPGGQPGPARASPKDATAVRLVAFAPGEDDADLKVQLASPSGLITPAGTRDAARQGGHDGRASTSATSRAGEAGSLIARPRRGTGGAGRRRRCGSCAARAPSRRSAFIPATAPVGARATVADNSAKGSTLSLTAPGGAAQVKVTASAGSEGGTAGRPRRTRSRRAPPRTSNSAASRPA